MPREGQVQAQPSATLVRSPGKYCATKASVEMNSDMTEGHSGSERTAARSACAGGGESRTRWHLVGGEADGPGREGARFVESEGVAGVVVLRLIEVVLNRVRCHPAALACRGHVDEAENPTHTHEPLGGLPITNLPVHGFRDRACAQRSYGGAICGPDDKT